MQQHEHRKCVLEFSLALYARYYPLILSSLSLDDEKNDSKKNDGDKSDGKVMFKVRTGQKG